MQDRQTSKTIVVGIDGTEVDDAAVRFAVEEAARRGAERIRARARRA